MPKVRALKPMFYGGNYYKKGQEFEISEGAVAYAAKRIMERKITPAFALVVSAEAVAARQPRQPKTPKAPESEIA